MTAATIVSGGVAERLQMGGYLIFTTFMTAFIYPTVGAMTWGHGLLYDYGYYDFAGSGNLSLRITCRLVPNSFAEMFAKFLVLYVLYVN